MKVYVVYKAECIYDYQVDEIFSTFELAKKHVDKSLPQYAEYLKKETIEEIYAKVIEEFGVLDKSQANG